MRVKCINNSGDSLRLTLGKNYAVYEGEYIYQDGTREYITFKIEDNYGSVIPYNAKNFEITSDYNNNYVEHRLADGKYTCTHSFILAEYFWSRLYDDDYEMREKLLNAKKDIYYREMSKEEILEILKSENWDEIDLIVNLFTEKKNDEYVDFIINRCQTHLDNWEYSNNLLSLFQYLSVFENDAVNQFFIDYLSENEKGNDELNTIVYKYFNNDASNDEKTSI